MEHGVLYYFGIAFVALGIVLLTKALVRFLRNRLNG